MSLRNFIKVDFTKNKLPSWQLFDLNGNEIAPFNDFAAFILDKYAYNTQDKYTQVVSKFLDYLVEVDVFEKEKTKAEFKQVIDNFLWILRLGDKTDNLELNLVSEKLQINPISPNSWANTIAAINLFLKVSSSIAEEQLELASIKNKIALPIEYKSFMPELDSSETMNFAQKNAARQRSFMASLVRKVGEIKNGYTINKPRIKKELDENLDFPTIMLPKLLSSTFNHRDRAIYALMAGTGIRSSEALNIKWTDVDIKNQKIHIRKHTEDKKGKESFKGRNTGHTFFIPELRVIFFQALYLYQKDEVDIRQKHDYVFQFLDFEKKGKAYYQVSREGFIKNFVKTCEKAGIQCSHKKKQKKHWTPHSLRHFYGVYMLNYIPTDKGFGFSIEEVQHMMGHKSILVTQQYARKTKEHIEAQLEYAERVINGGNMSLSEFNNLLIEKYNSQILELKKDA